MTQSEFLEKKQDGLKECKAYYTNEFLKEFDSEMAQYLKTRRSAIAVESKYYFRKKERKKLSVVIIIFYEHNYYFFKNKNLNLNKNNANYSIVLSFSYEFFALASLTLKKHCCN